MSVDKHIPDPRVLAVFDTMIAGVDGVERKGDQNPYCSINGNMYAQMSKLDKIGLRLSSWDLDEFQETFNAPLHEGYPGFFQKEYVEIPKALYDETATLQAWFRRSYANAKQLKRKPTGEPKK